MFNQIKREDKCILYASLIFLVMLLLHGIKF
jgi:hypothetical protein